MFDISSIDKNHSPSKSKLGYSLTQNFSNNNLFTTESIATPKDKESHKASYRQSSDLREMNYDHQKKISKDDNNQSKKFENKRQENIRIENYDQNLSRHESLEGKVSKLAWNIESQKLSTIGSGKINHRSYPKQQMSDSSKAKVFFTFDPNTQTKESVQFKTINDMKENARQTTTNSQKLSTDYEPYYTTSMGNAYSSTNFQHYSDKENISYIHPSNEKDTDKSALLESQVLVENTYLKYRLEELNNSKIDLLCQLQSKENDLKELNALLTNEKKSSKKLLKNLTVMDSHKAEILSLNNQIGRLSKVNMEVQRRLDESLSGLHEKEEVIKEFQKLVEVANSKFKDYEESMTSLNNAVANQNEYINKLGAKISDKDDEINYQANLIGKLQEELNFVKSEYSLYKLKQEEEIEKSSCNMNLEFKAMYDEMEAKLKSTFTSEMMSMQDKIQNLTIENEALKLESRSKELSVMELDTLLEMKKEKEMKLELVTVQLNELNQKLEKRNSEYTSLLNEQIEIKGNYTKSQEENIKLKSKQIILSSESRNKSSIISQLEGQINQLIQFGGGSNQHKGQIMNTAEASDLKSYISNLEAQLKEKVDYIDVMVSQNYKDFSNKTIKESTEFKSMEKELIYEINKRKELEKRYGKLQEENNNTKVELNSMKDKQRLQTDTDDHVFKFNINSQIDGPSFLSNYEEDYLKERLNYKSEEIKQLKRSIGEIKEKLQTIITKYQLISKSNENSVVQGVFNEVAQILKYIEVFI